MKVADITVYVHTHAYIHLHTNLYTYMYKHIYTFTHMYKYISKRRLSCNDSCRSVYRSLTYMYMYMNTYIYIHIYYMHILRWSTLQYMNKYIHTRKAIMLHRQLLEILKAADARAQPAHICSMYIGFFITLHQSLHQQRTSTYNIHIYIIIYSSSRICIAFI